MQFGQASQLRGMSEANGSSLTRYLQLEVVNIVLIFCTVLISLGFIM